MFLALKGYFNVPWALRLVRPAVGGSRAAQALRGLAGGIPPTERWIVGFGNDPSRKWGPSATRPEHGMPFSFWVALRYLASTRRVSIAVASVLAIIGVAFGTSALAVTIGVTGGFRAEFKEKVLGVNAHVLVMRYAGEFHDYREVMEKLSKSEGVVAIAPFTINPMMLTHGGNTATGVQVKGIDPLLSPGVLDLPSQIVEGSLDGLRRPGAAPPKSGRRPFRKDNGEATDPQRSSDEPDAPEDAPAQRRRPAALPLGRAIELEPDAGYGSVLPEDDELPDELNLDPCETASSDLPGLVIGTSLKEDLDVQVGDCVLVTSPFIGFHYSNRGVAPPVAKQFRVAAIFSAGFDQYDSKFAFIDFYEAQTFHEAGDIVTGVEMRVDDIDNAGVVRQGIERDLNDATFHTLDWDQLNRGLFTALRVQQIVMSLVLALITLVAAFTVVATLIMMVLEKKHEIAALKAMGATDGSILRVFLFQGAIIGLAGTALGLGGGWWLCEWIATSPLPLDPEVYFISHVPVRIDPEHFFWTGAFALVVCVGATFWPAQYAARLRPAEAFREP